MVDSCRDDLVYSVAASDATLRMLLIALVAGTVAILPALGWLFMVFKRPGHKPLADLGRGR